VRSKIATPTTTNKKANKLFVPDPPLICPFFLLSPQDSKDMATKAQGQSVVNAELNECVKAGLLLTLTAGTLMKSYQKRWFVLLERQLNHELVFHTSETKLDKKGRLNLDEVIEIRREPSSKVSKSFSKGPDEELRFELVCDGKVFELAAMSRSEKADWLAVLSRVCDLPIQGSDDGSGTTFAHQGVLLKQSGGGKRNKVWAQRFFTLRTEGVNPSLAYYSGPKESSLKGTILLEDVTEVRAWSKNDGTEAPALSSRFEVVTHARTYIFATVESGAEDKEVWMERIASSCSLEISRVPEGAEAGEGASADSKFSGWLSKQGGGSGGLKNWKSRFFVLTSEKLTVGVIFFIL
jgi:hypothetical protein